MFKASAVFESHDKGKAEIEKSLRRLSRNKVVAVGVLGDGGVALYASANEYGTEYIPARPFVRPSIASPELKAFSKQNAKDYYRGAIATLELGLERLGNFARGLIVKKIGSNVPPPNADSTIAMKGSSATLIDTGRMRQSITYQVRHR